MQRADVDAQKLQQFIDNIDAYHYAIQKDDKQSAQDHLASAIESFAQHLSEDTENDRADPWLTAIADSFTTDKIDYATLCKLLLETNFISCVYPTIARYNPKFCEILTINKHTVDNIDWESPSSERTKLLDLLLTISINTYKEKNDCNFKALIKIFQRTLSTSDDQATIEMLRRQVISLGSVHYAHGTYKRDAIATLLNTTINQNNSLLFGPLVALFSKYSKLKLAMQDFDTLIRSSIHRADNHFLFVLLSTYNTPEHIQQFLKICENEFSPQAVEHLKDVYDHEEFRELMDKYLANTPIMAKLHVHSYQELADFSKEASRFRIKLTLQFTAHNSPELLQEIIKHDPKLAPEINVNYLLPAIHALLDNDSTHLNNQYLTEILTILRSLNVKIVKENNLTAMYNACLELFHTHALPLFEEALLTNNNNDNTLITLFDEYFATQNLRTMSTADPLLTLCCKLIKSGDVTVERICKILSETDFPRNVDEAIFKNNLEFCNLLVLNSDQSDVSSFATISNQQIYGMRTKISLLAASVTGNYDLIIHLIEQALQDKNHMEIIRISNKAVKMDNAPPSEYTANLHRVLLGLIEHNLHFEFRSVLHNIFHLTTIIPTDKLQGLFEACIVNGNVSFIKTLELNVAVPAQHDLLLHAGIKTLAYDDNDHILNILQTDDFAQYIAKHCAQYPNFAREISTSDYELLDTTVNGNHLSFLENLNQLSPNIAIELLEKAIFNNPEIAIQAGIYLSLEVFKDLLHKYHGTVDNEEIARLLQYWSKLPLEQIKTDKELLQLYSECETLLTTISESQKPITMFEERLLAGDIDKINLWLYRHLANMELINYEDKDPWLSLCCNLVNLDKINHATIDQLLSPNQNNSTNVIKYFTNKLFSNNENVVNLLALTGEEKIDLSQPINNDLFELKLKATIYRYKHTDDKDSTILYRLLSNAIALKKLELSRIIMAWMRELKSIPEIQAERSAIDNCICTIIKFNQIFTLEAMVDNLMAINGHELLLPNMDEYFTIAIQNYNQDTTAYIIEALLKIHPSCMNVLLESCSKNFATHANFVCSMLNNHSNQLQLNQHLKHHENLLDQLKINSYDELEKLLDTTDQNIVLYRLSITFKFFKEEKQSLLQEILVNKPWLLINIAPAQSLSSIQLLLENRQDYQNLEFEQIHNALASFKSEKIIRNDTLRKLYDQCVEMTNKHVGNKAILRKNLLRFNEQMHTKKSTERIYRQSISNTRNLNKLLDVLIKFDPSYDRRIVNKIKKIITDGLCYALTAGWLYTWNVPNSSFFGEYMWLTSKQFGERLAYLASDQIQASDFDEETKNELRRADLILQNILALSGLYQSIISPSTPKDNFVTTMIKDPKWKANISSSMQDALLFGFPIDSMDRILDKSLISSIELTENSIIGYNSFILNLLDPIEGHAIGGHRIPNTDDYLIYDPNGFETFDTFYAKRVAAKDLVTFLNQYLKSTRFANATITGFNLIDPQPSNKSDLSN